MESVITAFVVIILVLTAGLSLTYGLLDASNRTLDARHELEERLHTQGRTSLSAIDAQTFSGGTVLEVTFVNDGNVRLTEFDRWDMWVQFYDDADDYFAYWLPYLPGEPISNEWTVVGIYDDAASLTPEAFEPGILNPGEEMVVRARVSPAVGTGTSNLATLSTDTGIRSPAPFAG